MKTIETLGHPNTRTSFSYEGSVKSGVLLLQSGKSKIDAAFFTAALEDFAGQEVKGGFREDDPPKGGFGDWVQRNSGRLNSRKLSPRHASFMAAILCHECEVTSWLRGTAVWLRFPKKAAAMKGESWFEQKVAELKAEIENLPADRQEQLKRELKQGAGTRRPREIRDDTELEAAADHIAYEIGL